MNRFMPIAVASALALSASPVLSHARLVSATPGDGATVTAPRTISLTFSERFAAPFSTVEVEDGRGRAVALTKSVSEDGKTLGGSFAAPLDQNGVGGRQDVGRVVRSAAVGRDLSRDLGHRGGRRSPHDGKLQLHRPLTCRST